MKNIKIDLIFILSLFVFLSCASDYEVEYYENGTVKSKVKKKSGILHGEFFYYYQNGNVKSKGIWNGGEGNGYIEKYDSSNGNLIERSNWINRKQNGFTELFFANKSPKYKSDYKNGCPCGNALFFDSLNHLVEKRIYDNNCRQYYSCLYDSSLTKWHELLIPLLAKKNSGDSIIINLSILMNYKGAVRFDFYRIVNQKEILLKRFETSNTNDKLRIPATIDTKIYYRYHYYPSEEDTLFEHGFEGVVK